MKPPLETSGVDNSGEAGQGLGRGRGGDKIPPTLAKSTATSSEASLDGPALQNRNVNAFQTVSEPPGMLVESARDWVSEASPSTPNLAQGSSNEGGGREPPRPPLTPVSLPNRGEGGEETFKTTTEVETESSGSANASSKARGGRQLAAAARLSITKIINKK